MKKEERNGIIWTGAERLIGQALGFVQGIILARLLSPNDFGLAAMLGIFLGVGGILAESGLASAYVVYGGEERKVFRWNVGMAVGIYALLAIAAPWIAAFYRQPILKELTLVMGLSIVIYAASVVKMARLQREKRFGMISIVNLSSILAAFAVGVGMAAGGCGVWAIVGAGLASGVCRLGGIVAVGSRSGREESNDEQFKKMLGFGLKAMASGLIGSLYFHSTRLIIGRVFDPTAVGLFHRAQHWATLPGNMVNESVGRVALPALAQREESVKVKGRSVKWWKVNVLLLWPGLAVLWIWAEEIVRFVLGAQWVDSVPYMRILMLATAFTPLSNVAEIYLKARERADLLLVGEAFKKPVQIAALVVGAFGGVEGLCWAIVVGEATSAAVNYALVRRSRI